jgi:hypothetical protein
VADVVDGLHRANLAAQRRGSLPNREEVVLRVLVSHDHVHEAAVSVTRRRISAGRRA